MNSNPPKTELLTATIYDSTPTIKNKYISDFITSKPEIKTENIQNSDLNQVLEHSNLKYKNLEISQSLHLSFLHQLSIFLLALLYCYNPFILERFLMGQDRIFWGFFLILPYIYNLLKYIKISKTDSKSNEVYFWTKLRLIIISVLVSLSNIHTMIILAIFSFVISIVFLKEKLKTIYFSVFNLLLIVASLIFNFKLLNLTTSSYYFNNIAQNPEQIDQIVSAFSAQAKTNQNLILRVLSGSASWNTPTFVEIDQIEKKLGLLSNFSLYFNQYWNILYLAFLGCSILAGLYFLSKLSCYKKIILPFGVLAIISIVFTFGYSVSFLKPFNKLLLNIPGAYTFREPGKVYIIFWIIIIFLISVVINHLANFEHLKKKYWYGYVAFLSLIVISNMIPFFQLSNNLNYLKIPNLVQYSLNNCQNRTLAVLPSNTYIVPNYSKVFIVNPFLVTKNQNCKIIKSNKIELQGKDGNKINLDISGDNEKFDQIMTKYLNNLPKINNGEIVVDVSNQADNKDLLTKNLKDININLLFVDFDSIDYKLYLKNDLDMNAKLLKQEGNFALYEL